MRWSALCLPAALAILLGCGRPVVYPMQVGEADAIPVDEFGDLDLVPDTFKGRAVMMAGRIVGVEPDGQGVIIVAEWLPVPKDMGKGPSEVDVKPDRKFVVHYPKAIDSAGLWEGNKFVAVGRIQDADRPTGHSSLPSVDASCLHIWKTRGLSIAGTLEDERGRFPVLEQTYCLNS
ncbi:MAG TPA: hypothetical protein VJ805_05795 [Nitrospiraceae bacterium]|nr:hypothetical protein [Nitrospiraceae bacterium]